MFEPFFGSGAVLLGRPHDAGIETVNDADGFICNAYRAIRDDPDAVAYHADHPVSECDLHARHLWLVERREMLSDRLMGDIDYYDAKIAGFWIWGMACWIGGGFCSGKGPWQSVDGVLAKREEDTGRGINRQRPHLSKLQGINRRRPHLHRSHGIKRGLPHLGNNGKGVNRQEQNLKDYMQALSDRLRHVRVCCGDWARVMGPSVTSLQSINGVFLDPPYDQSKRTENIYTVESNISSEVRDWAIANGDNHRLRIALCGYECEHEMPDTWRVIEWKTQGGYANRVKGGRGNENKSRERIWFSPHCLNADKQLDMFG